jgi:hypothetical protein
MEQVYGEVQDAVFSLGFFGDLRGLGLDSRGILRVFLARQDEVDRVFQVRPRIRGIVRACESNGGSLDGLSRR